MGLMPFRHGRRIDADTVGIYTNDMTRVLQIDKSAASAATIRGLGSSPVLAFNGASNKFVTTGVGIDMNDVGGTLVASISGIAAELSLWGRGTNADVFIRTTGTGVAKFGTYTILGAETSAGFITIKDAGGTERKLLVVA